MDKAVAALKEEFGSLRTGRASAGLLDQVQVEAYGATHADQPAGRGQRARAAVDHRQRLGQGLVVSVEKAIRNAGLGLNPVVEGQNLRIPIPPLTEERRRDLAKLAGRYAEQQRIAVRNVRREAMEDLRKAEKDGDHQPGRAQAPGAEVQKLTDEAVRRVDEALKTKEQEIMQV